MRYFYTDPLAAAWMAKHFGMRFVNVDVAYDDSPEKLCALLDDMGYGDGKNQIHPDNLQLLMPQVGDVVEYEWNAAPALHAIIDKSQPHAITDDEWAYEARDVFTEAQLPILLEPTATRNLRIIQRNGIPFMWPESE
jgi:hypothetical protein